MRTIDLRSDTVTHPTPEMRQAMAEAEVGDDVLGDDPTVHRLEAMAAERMGKEAAVYVSSGTMGNLLAVLSWCERGDEVILGSEAHILWHESASSAAIAGTLLRPVPNDPRGMLDPDDIEHAVRSYRPGVSPTGLVALENTHNRCSGAALSPSDTRDVAQVAHRHGLPLHLDGARIFNAAVAQEIPAGVLAGHADSVTFCFSKGLSAPIGSALCGPADFIATARKWRKMLGGGMRQLGVIAAAAIVSLETMVPRLAEDHQNARRLANGLAEIPGIVIDPERIETNIVIFEWHGGPHAAFMAKLAEAGVLASSTGAPRVRMVTHYGINAEDIDDALKEIRRVAAGAQEDRAHPGGLRPEPRRLNQDERVEGRLRKITAPLNFQHAGQLLELRGNDPRLGDDFEPSKVVIDLSKCKFIWPSAVIWCACYALLVRNLGRDCELVIPEDTGVSAYLQAAALFSMLQEAGVEVDTHGISQASTAQTILPLSRFTTVFEADQCSNIALERLTEMGFPGPQVAATVSEGFSEFANNAAQHAQSPIGGIGMVQYYRFREGSRFVIAVGDGGIGIRKSLSNNPNLRGKLDNDQAAIALATREMVSGTGDPHRGMGLFTATEYARSGRRRLIIHSGNGVLRVNENDKGIPHGTNPFPGTLAFIGYDVM